MDQITPEQFLESVKGWKPEDNFRQRVEKQLKQGKAPEGMIHDLGEAFELCSNSTYHYIQFINELATNRELNKKNFLPQVAELVGLVEAVQDSGRKFQDVFRRFDELSRPGLVREDFDTVYYDAIQGIDIRDMLKTIFDEVEVVLKTFSLVSTDLLGVQCLNLFENSIRFQLFLRYFICQENLSREELWSVLFDIFSQMSDMLEMSVEPTEDELADLEAKIEKYKTN